MPELHWRRKARRYRSIGFVVVHSSLRLHVSDRTSRLCTVSACLQTRVSMTDGPRSFRLHDCTRAGGRCMKAVNKEGQKICRYHRQPPLSSESHGQHWFEPIATPYTDEVYALLQEMGLAVK